MARLWRRMPRKGDKRKMTMQEVIANELKCVQRDCCRLENECAKCDLVLPKEEIINAYNKALRLEKENAELKKELKKWKDEWQEQTQKENDESFARTLQTIQLNKAKEYIRTLISCLINWVQEGDKDYCYITDAEQFLREE